MSDTAPDDAPPSLPPPEAVPRRTRGPIIAAVVAIVIVIGVVAASPFWRPAVMRVLPWGRTAAEKPPVTAADIAALKAESSRNAAAVQQLSQRLAVLEARPAPDAALQQRLAALEAKPAPDLSGVQQQLAALGKTTADLGDKVAVLGKAEQQQAAADPKAALALVLLQIRGALDVGRPFDAEYHVLAALAHDHPDIAAAAQPLAGPAQTGVASRAALVERLRQIAPQIATAHPPPRDNLKSQVVARLRSLVTIRRIDGGGQTPAEAAVATAQDDAAKGDLAGAAAALDQLEGPNKSAAEPWLKMAKARLDAESALREVEAALTASLGTAAPAAGGQGG